MEHWCCYCRSCAVAAALVLLLQVLCCYCSTGVVTAALVLLLQVLCCYCRSCAVTGALVLLLEQWCCYCSTGFVTAALVLLLQHWFYYWSTGAVTAALVLLLQSVKPTRFFPFNSYFSVPFCYIINLCLNSYKVPFHVTQVCFAFDPKLVLFKSVNNFRFQECRRKYLKCKFVCERIERGWGVGGGGEHEWK